MIRNCCTPKTNFNSLRIQERRRTTSAFHNNKLKKPHNGFIHINGGLPFYQMR